MSTNATESRNLLFSNLTILEFVVYVINVYVCYNCFVNRSYLMLLFTNYFLYYNQYLLMFFVNVLNSYL